MYYWERQHRYKETKEEKMENPSSISIPGLGNATRSCSRGTLSRLAFLILPSIVLFFPVKPVHGYANWLKCYIELDDPEEVIMHRSIIPSDQQPDDERVFIEVQPYASRRDDAWFALTLLDHEEIFAPSVYNETMSTLLKLRLKVPPKLQKKDFQFVIDVAGEGVSFVGPGAVCDGNRSFSRQHDDHVLLKIESADAFRETVAADGPQEHSREPPSRPIGNIDLVAGWAAGYEAVKLTPKMIVRRRNVETETKAATGYDDSIDGEL